MIQIHNSLTRSKQLLEPIEPGKIRMYVCGMTVYDFCHIGHARVMVVFDMVVRYLRHRGFEVDYVRNITDIDDKIIQRAAERGESISELTEFFIAAMHEDAAALGVQPPDAEPRATAAMDEIVAMIARLVDGGFAYRAGNGDVYYRVSRFEHYGRLSNKRLEDLRAGERVEVGEAKEDPLDFVLWKAARPDEPQWDSPWGPGRPGWHIECSAMSTHCLGDHFDIHGGGMDLMFPHHENEIAQSEAATGHTFVNIWMHNGFVQINEEKMSKSLGNFFTVREVLRHYRPEAVRLFILGSHYRSPLNYSDRNLDTARATLDGFYQALRGLAPESAQTDVPAEDEYTARFTEAMDDDFNTAGAIAVLNDLRAGINRAKGEEDRTLANRLAGRLVMLGNVLGLLQQDPEAWFQGGDAAAEAVDTATIEQLIRERSAARARRDWAESDRIRDELDALGVVVEDGAQGTSWRRR